MKTWLLCCIVTLLSTAAGAAEWSVKSVTEKSVDGRRYLTVTVAGTDGVPEPKSFTIRAVDQNRKRFTVSNPKYDRAKPDHTSYTFFMSEETLAQRKAPIFSLTISAEGSPDLVINHPIGK